MEKLRKSLISIMLMSILMFSFYGLINSESYAQTISTNITNIDSSKYPGIKEKIQALQKKYPNWKFKILYTDLDWNTVIANEYVHTSGGSRNYVQATSSYQGAWICPACNYKDGLWRCASEEALKYMIDPRNSLNETDIFQFEELTNSGYELSVIKQMTKSTFLQGYESLIAKAADTTGVSPYYIVGRLIQEQGPKGTALSAGYKIDDVLYYNPFNIQASGTNPISAGAVYAKSQGWNTLEKSIIGGINFLANEYTKKGQNTLYLQKFDVDSKHYGLYWHQYMQNIMAAQSEGTTLRKTYQQINAINTSHTFIIPVYKNMPKQACTRPNSSTTSVVTTDIVKVNVNSTIGLRDAPNGNRLSSVYLSKDEIVTRIEKATSKVGGTYWDKIKKADGTVAYVARETYDYEKTYKLYLVPVSQNNTNNSTNNSSNSNASNNNNTSSTTDKNNTTSNNSSNNSQTQGNSGQTININTDNIKLNNTKNNITIAPEVLYKDLETAFNKTITITKKDGKKVENKQSDIGTGYVIDGKYTVIKLGDCNGDGKTNALDAAVILRYSVGQYQLKNEYLQAGKLSENEKPTALDAAKILRYSVGQYEI